MTATEPKLTKRTLGGLPIAKPADEKIPFLNNLFYGDPGAGKTTLAASAADVEEMSPVILLDVEGGTLSLRKRHPNVDVVRLTSFNDFNVIGDELRKDFASDSPAYKTVILDSLTEIQKFGMYEIMKRVLLKAEETGEERDPDLPSIGEWGKNIEQTRKVIRFFRDLPCHTIFTALAMTERVRGKETAKPSLSGKLSNEVAGFIDIVGYMYKREVDGEMKRMLYVEGNELVVAKDRTDVLPPVLESPTMSDIFNIITNS